MTAAGRASAGSFMVGYTLGRRLLVGDRGGGIIMTATTRGHNILMYTTRDEFQILGRPMRDGGCGHGFPFGFN